MKLQLWVKHSGLKVAIIFEGRDAAGKGGIIKRIPERVSPRVFRVIALPAPTEREKSQMYIQRYVSHLPAAGEVGDLSTEAGSTGALVEGVMGFCTEEQAQYFLRMCPQVEEAFVRSGIILIKYWIEVSQEEKPAASSRGSMMAAKSGSSVRWTSNPIVAGTTTRARAMR